MSRPDDFDEDQAPPIPAGPPRRGPIEIDVRIKAEGMRLDRYLALNFQEFSRSVFQDAIDSGNVLVNDKPSKSSYKVRSGDHLRLQLPEPTHDLPVPEDIPLDVLYEDEW